MGFALSFAAPVLEEDLGGVREAQVLPAVFEAEVIHVERSRLATTRRRLVESFERIDDVALRVARCGQLLWRLEISG